MRGLPEDFPRLDLGDILEPRGFSLVQLRDEREVAIAMRAIALAREHFGTNQVATKSK